MSAISSSFMFFSFIFLLIINNRTKSFFFIIIFIWYKINSSFSRLSIDPYVYTCTSWRILAACKMSLSFYLLFTIISTHLAYSTLCYWNQLLRGKSFLRTRLSLSQSALFSKARLYWQAMTSQVESSRSGPSYPGLSCSSNKRSSHSVFTIS